MDRRNFLKVAGAAGVVAATSSVGEAGAAEKVSPRGPKGMARGLTLLTFRKGGELRLGVKTAGGILDVKQAATLLHMKAPGTLDDLLQDEDGPRLCWPRTRSPTVPWSRVPARSSASGSTTGGTPRR
jgi:hypothetical protein